MIPVPATDLAIDAGNIMAAPMVMLGALCDGDSGGRPSNPGRDAAGAPARVSDKHASSTDGPSRSVPARFRCRR